MPHSFVPGCTLRYFFNLTDGTILIRDEQGIEAASIQSAMVSAMEMIEELRAEDPPLRRSGRAGGLRLSMA